MPRKPTYEELEKRVWELEQAEFQRKQTERRPQESEAKYRNLANSLHDWVWIITIEGVLIFCSRSSERILGYHPEEIIEKSIFFMLHPDGATEARAVLSKAVEERKGWKDLKLKCRHKDGSVRYLESTCQPNFDGDGNLTGFSGLNRNITGLKDAEAAQIVCQNWLKSIARIGVSANSSLELKLVLDSILKNTVQSLNADAGMMFLHDAEIGCLVWGASLGLSKAFVNNYKETPIHPGEGLSGRIWETGSPIFIRENSSDDARIHRDVVKKEGLNSFIGVPLHDEDRIIGVMNILTRPPKTLRQEDLDLCEAIATQVSLSIQNAMLFDTKVKTQKALLESEARYRILFEESPISLWDEDFSDVKQYIDALRNSGVKDLRQYLEDHPETVAHCASLVKITGVNMATLKLYGAASLEEFMGGLPAIFGEATYDVFKEELLSLVEGKTTFESEAVNRTFSGENKNVLIRCTVVSDYAETLSKVLISIVDITALKVTEEALWESNERFQKVFNSQLDAILVLDAQFPARIVECNTASKKVFGYETEELIGEPIEKLHVDVSHRKTFQDKLYASIERKGHLSDLEFVMKRKDRTLFPSEHSVFELKSDSGERTGWVSIIRDLTERKELEKRLIQAQKMESIGNLASGIAHDFNNLLCPIVGMSELLLHDLPSGSLERENTREILKAGRRGTDLVKQILAFSRQSEQKKIPTRIQQVLKEVLKLSRSTIPSYIEIHQNIQPDCKMVMADATQIHQVAMNITTNAYHAMEDTGGRISVTLAEAALGRAESNDMDLPAGEYAVLSISDTGNGISADLMGKIFEPYFTTKEKGKGTGLGLAVAYGIIHEHKGTIKVESEIRKGSTFTVYLPIMEKWDGAESIDTDEKWVGGNERILLVDDDESVATLEKQMLERMGYKVTSRLHSIEALEAFRSSPYTFDLVLTDMSMPKMTGVQLAEALLSIRPDTPIIICTGFSEHLTKEKMASFGLKGLLMKPIVGKKMAKMVRKVLDEDKAEMAH